MDTLVHIFRSLRLKTDIRINTNFVSFDYTLVDPEQENIIKSLIFFGMLDKKYNVLEAGMKYLQKESKLYPGVSEVFGSFPNIDYVAYNDTCLSSVLSTSANCGLC